VANAPAGPYPIVISSPVGTGLANYTITLVNGTMSVGSAPSVTTLDVQAVLGSGSATFSFTATVAPAATSGVAPAGTVTFTLDGAAGPFSTTPTALTNGKATVTNIALPAGVHKVTATFNPGDANFVSSNGSSAVTVVASLRGTPIVPGTNTTVQANVAYPGTGPTITLTGASTSNPPPLNNVTCVVTSSLSGGLPPTCTVTASFPVTISASSATGALTINLKTSTISASLHPAPLPSQHRFGALYAISMGMPAIVFMGLAVPLGTRRRKMLRGKLVSWVGLLLVMALLLTAVGCGGGFTNTNNAQPVVTAGASTPGNYTAILYYTDATGTHALVSVDFSVGQ
jgi:hypothetical protein